MFNVQGFITNENLIGVVDGIAIKKHHFVSNDTAGVIEAAGYFNTARDKGYIKKGDIVEVAGDRDGTPFHSSYTFSTVPEIGAGDVLLTEHKAVTQNVKQVLTVRIPVMGTASTHYVATPVAGRVSKVLGVSSAIGATLTDTVTISVPTTGAIATLPFLAATAAGAVIEDTTITVHTALLANGVITIANDGGGDGTGEIIVTIEITP